MPSRINAWSSRRSISILLHAAALLAPPLAGHAAAPARGQPVQMSGVVAEIVLDDFAHQSSRVEYQLDDLQSGRHATLRFDGDPPQGLHTGTQVSVTGVACDCTLAESADSRIEPTRPACSRRRRP